jgi:hypothetical protein
MIPPQLSNLRPGDDVPLAGIYVVSHNQPPHAAPHEVLISKLAILPRCKNCLRVRFSFRCPPTQPIEENEFFRH